MDIWSHQSKANSDQVRENVETWMIRCALNELLYIHACSVGVSGADGTQYRLHKQFLCGGTKESYL